jgi:hypothetical protein
MNPTEEDKSSKPKKINPLKVVDAVDGCRRWPREVEEECNEVVVFFDLLT